MAKTIFFAFYIVVCVVYEVGGFECSCENMFGYVWIWGGRSGEIFADG